MHSSVAVLLCCARFNENKGTMITLYWHKQKGTINNIEGIHFLYRKQALLLYWGASIY